MAPCKEWGHFKASLIEYIKRHLTSLLPEFFHMLIPEIGHLRLNHNPAICLVLVALVILQMLRLYRIECFQGFDFSHDWRRPNFPCIEVSSHLLSNLLLLRRLVQND